MVRIFGPLGAKRSVALGLVGAATLPAVALMLVPVARELLASRSTFVLPVVGLFLVPVIAAALAAWRGVGRILARLSIGRRGEQHLATTRVLLNAVLTVYASALLAVRPGDTAGITCLMVMAFASAVGWLLLLHIALASATSRLRQHFAIASDIGFLSALLHFGGELTAPCFPLYVFIAIASGFHYGRRSLLLAVLLNAASFSAVFASTPFWREPALAAGVLVCAVLVPLYAAALLERLKQAARRAETLSDARSRLIGAITEDLRRSLDPIVSAGAAPGGDEIEPATQTAMTQARTTARAMLLQLDDLRDAAEIETGWWVPETRSFDLHRVIDGAIAAIRPYAADLGISLVVRVDPRIPYELRGWPQQLRQILISLACATIIRSGAGRLRVAVDLVEHARSAVVVRVTLRGEAAGSNPGVQQPLTASGALGLAVGERLATMMGGRLTEGSLLPSHAPRGVELPFEVDEAAYAVPLDLAQRPILIVSRDTHFTRDLAEMISAWRGDARWVGAGDAALAAAGVAASSARRPVLVMDGRSDLLGTLDWINRAVTLPVEQRPYVFLAIGEARTETVAALAGEELTAILPSPITTDTLRHALHALRLEAGEGYPIEAPAPVPEMTTGFLPGEPLAGTLGVEEPTPPTPEVEVVRFEKPQPAPLPKRSVHVLVVARNASNRRIIEHILRRGEHTVSSADAVETVSDMLAEQAVDVVLLDAAAPGSMEFAAAAEWRQEQPDLAVVLLAGNVTPTTDRRCRDAGIDAVLGKPAEPSQLLDAIETAREARKAMTGPPRRRSSGPLSWRRALRAATVR